MQAVYITIDEARMFFEVIVGKKISRHAVYDIIRRHKTATKVYGRGLGVSLTSWRNHCLARTKGNVLTRPKKTYKKRGPKRKPRKKAPQYVKKRASERLKPGRKVDPESRRSLRKKRQTSQKLKAAAARRKALEDW
jgi:hypothetical protein